MDKKRNIILYIDTSSNEEITVGLKIDEKKYVLTRNIDKQKAQIALPMIDEILKKYNLSPQDINKIEVNIGPGSFTGIRVGITIANTLAFSLKISVNNKPIGKFVEPVYE